MSRIVDTIRQPPSFGDLHQVSPEPSDKREVGDPELGVVAYFHIHDDAGVERVMQGLRRLNVKHLRTGVSWADWHTERGRQWYEWLLPKLAHDFALLPCVLYTPPSLGILPKSSSPPRDPEAYGNFIDYLATHFAGLFDYIELWNEPNNYIEWDWTVDPEWTIFAQMIAGAASRARAAGVQPVLGGMSPLDPNWLDLMFNRGALDEIAVVGIHGFPGTWEAVWEGWSGHVHRVREVLDRHSSGAEIWITECGFSTWAHDEYRMLKELVEVARAPVPRVYWYSAEDLDPERGTLDGFHVDERAYHFGLYRRDGTPKLPARIWATGGIESMREVARVTTHGSTRRDRGGTLITGGAGFVGTNLAERLASEGKPVVILDNLGRPGVEANLRWLVERHGDLISAEIGDVRDRFALRRALEGCDEVFHLASQVAVTTSLRDPELDFDVNLRGTLNLLEEIRRLDRVPRLLFTSTNKVYGALEDIALEERSRRYEPVDDRVASAGISEERPLAFCSPYGCSKGSADQYVLDYASSFGIPTAVFRMSCIYGPHQLGTEDQGWVAHFAIQAINRDPIVVYGNGKQVRDLLFVDDLVEALLAAASDDSVLSGQAFNLGGGVRNSVSLLEVLDLIEELHGESVQVSFAPWRVADQRYYASDTSKFGAATGWKPTIGVPEGIERLYHWLVGRSRPSGPRAMESVSS